MATFSGSSPVDWSTVNLDGVDIGDEVVNFVDRMSFALAEFEALHFTTNPASTTTTQLSVNLSDGSALNLIGTNLNNANIALSLIVYFPLGGGIFSMSGTFNGGAETITEIVASRDGHEVRVNGNITLAASGDTYSGTVTSASIKNSDNYVVTLTGPGTVTGNDDDATFGGSVTGVKVELLGVKLFSIAGFSLPSTAFDGLDTVQGVLDLVLAGNDSLTGGTGNDFIDGGAGNDTLNGAVGADTLLGGTGNDTYINSADGQDTFTELAGQGSDTVSSAFAYTLPGEGESEIEHVLLTGSGNISATGNGLANRLTGNTGNNSLAGMLGNDTLTGNAGNDTLDGGAGNDSMDGGAGNDLIKVDSAQDVIVDASGTDTVEATIDYSIASLSFIENLVLTGTATSGTGNTGNNVLTGNTALTSTLAGGTGSDTYNLSHETDVVIEAANGGTDTVVMTLFSGESYTLAANVENLTMLANEGVGFQGVGNELNNVIVGTVGHDTILGGAGNDTLTGNAGNDSLDGGTGNDNMTGGAGDDTYVVNALLDTVTEAAGSGTDTVYSSLSYTLGANVENLVLAGSGNLNGTGNTQDNHLTGNAGANTLDGGAGNDTYVESGGDDVYVIAQSGDTIDTGSGSGTDTVRVALTGSTYLNISGMSGLENVVFTGTTAVAITGNANDNALTGNAGNDTLDGGDGADTLNGGAGSNRLYGGDGNDVYIVNGTGDQAIEGSIQPFSVELVSTVSGTNNSWGGMGPIYPTISGDGNLIAFEANTEDFVAFDPNNQSSLWLKDMDSGDLTRLGNATPGINIGPSTTALISGDGSRVVFQSSDSNWVGALSQGNIYYVDVSAPNTAHPAAFFDGIVDVGDTSAILADVSANGRYVVFGSTNAAFLDAIDISHAHSGGIIDAVVVADLQTGSFVVASDEGSVPLNNGIGVFGGSAISDDGRYVVFNSTATNLVAGDTNTQRDVFVRDLQDHDVNTMTTRVSTSSTGVQGNGLSTSVDISADGRYVLFDSASTNLVAGDTNGKIDVFVKDRVTNTTTRVSTSTAGVQGNDHSFGVDISADGRFVLFTSVATSLVAADTDSILDVYVRDMTTGEVALVSRDSTGAAMNGPSSYLLVGAAISDDGRYISVSAADAVLAGDTDGAADVMRIANPLYILPGGGIDRVESAVSYTLGANLENLTLTGTAATGTGNTLDNVLAGNASANTLDGGAGADTLSGGAGADTYVVDDLGDKVIESTSGATGGIDLVKTAVNFTLGANVENATLTAGAGVLTGNELNNSLAGGNGADTLLGGTGNDTLSGGAGNDSLDGGAGNDNMTGGAGDDAYVVDATLDTVTEAAGGGTDTVYSAVSFTLGANLENLVLTGSANVNGTGNTQDNHLTGNAGANTLDGGTGNDTYVESDGDDVYVIAQAADTIDASSGSGTDTVRVALAGNPYLDISGMGWLENVTFTGTTGVKITGNANDNALTGGTGADTLIGDAGNDTYVVNNTTDVVSETGTDTSDTVLSSVSYTLGANLENLTLTGTAATGTGNTQDNVLVGNASANTLDGGAAGADTMSGGAGADTYVVDSIGDVVQETIAGATGGTDLVKTAVSFTLGANLENATLTAGAGVLTGNELNNSLAGGNGNDTLIGGTGNDTLTGGAGNDSLDGGSGNDNMTGGAGDDAYVVDATLDTVTEAVNGGTDTVYSALSFTLGANLENLVLTGSANVNGTGNTQDNHLTGNAGANTLDGGTGNDTYVESDGDDVYVIAQAADTIDASSGSGVDTVRVALANSAYLNISGMGWLENVTFTGTAGVVITGNTGDNALTGGTGADTLIGSLGNDTYVVNNTTDVVIEAGVGTDTVLSSVSYTLGAGVENLTLTGTAASGTGNSSDNVLVGNASANTLDGGAGADTLSGGAGADTYVVDDLGDKVIESTSGATGGIDLVKTAVNFTLGANVENATLTAGAGVLTGNELNNSLAGGNGADTLLGGTGNDTLSGGAGNDSLDGGAGNDNMTGGAGDDAYVVDATLDTVTEAAGGGTDTVYSAVSFTLGANLENLVLTGSANVNGTGNTQDNHLTGNAGANTLTGGTGNDTLEGGAGTDTLIGGAGNDVYVYDANDTMVEAAGAGTDVLTSGTVSVTLTAANIENILLGGTLNIDATGSAGANLIAGNSGDNVLNGGGGADTLQGGAGNDTYVVDGLDDVLSDTGGVDTVQASISYTLATGFENLTLTGTAATGTGNTLDNVLTGNASANTLDGGAGADTLMGGAGNDTYVVDSAGDQVVEAASAGTDLVQASANYSLAANVEDLVLTGSAGINGTGNTQDNHLTGNAGANILDGGAGGDTLTGGAGNDTYVVDSAGDQVVEAASAGTDLVQSSIDYSLGANLENLTLLDGASIGTGNSVDNSIIGNSAANTLSGGAGNDTLTGGDGNDTYVVDSSGDTVVETAGNGTDLVLASTSYTLAANVENLTLTAGGLTGTGNSDANIITASAAGDTLSGGLGADQLFGGAGNDVFIWDSADSSISGGGGTDTLSVQGGGVDVNLTTTTVALSSIETIDITGSGANSLIVDAAHVTTDSGGTLKVTGNTGDSVTTTDHGWTAGSTSGGFTTYTNGGATMQISTAVTVTLLGAGNDTYVVDSVDDIVTESANAGTDLVQASIDYSLPNNVENLTLFTGATTGIGNSLANVITGNADANILSGGGGNDSIDGGGGDDTITWDSADSLVGGSGTDTLHVDGSGVDLALTEIINSVSGFEAVDLTGSGDNVLVVSAAKITSMFGGNLHVEGNAGDRVIIADTGTEANGQDTSNPWTMTVGEGVHTYTNGSVTLDVDDAVEVVQLNALIDNSTVAFAEVRYPNFGFREKGDSPGDVAGASLAHGDINGDGFDDLVITASDFDTSADTMTSGQGATYVIFGDTRTGFARDSDLANIDGTNGFRIDGAIPDAGIQSTAVGDINGDGFADIVIVGGKGSASLAEVDVIFGTDSGFSTTMSVADLDGSNGFKLTVDGLEHSVATGDINGDGYDDIIVGSPNEKWVNGAQQGSVNEGLAYVVYGKATAWAASAALDENIPHSLGDRLIGTGVTSSINSTNWATGTAVAAVDLTGDGLDDVVIGAPGAEQGTSDQGLVYVVNAENVSGDDAPLGETLLFVDQPRIRGEAASADAGTSLGSAGDVNGDGYEDLIVGAPGQTGGGAAYVIFGGPTGFGTLNLSSLDGTNGFKILAASSGDNAGGGVSAAGDVNGDGYGDLLVGAPLFTVSGVDSGEAYLIYGKATWDPTFALTSLDGANGITFHPEDVGGLTGLALSSAGDLDGDGFADFMIGAPHASPNGSNIDKGFTYIFYGGDYNGAADQVGTSGDDSLTGTSGNDNIVAGTGNDTISGGGGKDAIHAGAGDDVIVVPEPAFNVVDGSFVLIDGGSGTDTFVFSGADFSLDLTALGNQAITGIEAFDLTGSGDNALTLALQDVLALSESSNQLTVDGDVGDVLYLADDWTMGGTAGGHTTYTSGAATLLVNTDVDVVPLAT